MQSQLPKAEEIELYIKDIGELEKRKIMNNSLIYNFVDIVKKLKNSLRFRKKSKVEYIGKFTQTFRYTLRKLLNILIIVR